MKFKGYTIISDVDGTLLNSKGKLSEENLNAINYFIDNGGIFSLATGRMLPSARRFISKIRVGLPVVLYNGTKVYDYINEKIVFETFLENERKHILKTIKEDNQNLGIEVYSNEQVYIYQSCKYTNRFSKLGYDVIYDIDDSIWDKRWTKVLILGEEDEIDKLEKIYKEKYEEGATIRSGEKFFEIVPNNTSKGQAVEQLCKEYNIDTDKLTTIGDNMNDLELLKVGKYGFCVENGNKRLIDTIDLIAPCNDDHAIEFVVKWLEDIISTKI